MINVPSSIISDGNALFRSFLKSKEGSGWKPDVQLFEMNWLLNLSVLQKELENRIYKPVRGNNFILNERGRTRIITGRKVRDRIVGHSLCDYVIQPSTQPYLIHENGASQKNKGVDFQRKLLKKHLINYYSHRGNEGYILLGDFSKYYDNILHDKVREQLRELIDDEIALYLIDQSLDSFRVDISGIPEEQRNEYINSKFNSVEFYLNTPKKSMTGEYMMNKHIDIGDQISQNIGLYYPHRIDNYVKIVRGQKWYGRYQDDFYVIAQTKEELWSILDGIKEEAKELGIFINEKKTHICKLSNPFRFLQIKYTLTDSGKIIQKINPKRITIERRKLKKLKKKVSAGQIPYKDVENQFKCWMGSAAPYMSKRQRNNMYDLFNELFNIKLEYINGKYTTYNNTKRRNKSRYNPKWEQLYNVDRSSRDPVQS